MPIHPVSILAVLLASGCKSPDHPPVTGTVETHSLASELVRDSYEIFVRLPPDYDAGDGSSHPVVYQLDANLSYLMEFDVTAGFASELEADETIEPTIVVGIGYPADPGPAQGRMRDFTPPDVNGDTIQGAGEGADDFYAFLREELTPWLEEQYAIAGPEGRALFGHSLGGLFSMYALLQHDPTDPFLGNFVVASPSFWWDSGSIYSFEEDFAARTDQAELRLFMTTGDFESPTMSVYFDDFAQRVEDRSYEGLVMTANHNREDHVGNISPSFREGLAWLSGQGMRGEP